MARPKKPESETHVNRLSVYLTDDDFALIRQLAARKGIPAGVLGRSLIVAKLEKISISIWADRVDMSRPH